MGIGAINGMDNGYGYQNNVKKSGNVTGSFDDVLGGTTMTCSSTPGLVLHMSKEGDAEKSIGCFADAISGKSVTVYKPEDFDENNPVYHVKIWDTDGNVTERMVDILRNIMKQQYDLGNFSGYLEYKKFWEFLSSSNIQI